MSAATLQTPPPEFDGRSAPNLVVPGRIPAPSTLTTVDAWSVLRRLSVDEYHQLIRDGFFAPDERCELLDGLIVKKTPRDPVHDACIAACNRILSARLPAGWHVRVQSAVTSKTSEPEPDLAIVRGVDFDYVAHHPGPADAALLVEIANSSVSCDREWKGRSYAQAGFPLYWLVNLVERRIEVGSDPSGLDAAPAYRRWQEYRIGQIVPLVIGDVALQPIAVGDLLPPAV